MKDKLRELAARWKRISVSDRRDFGDVQANRIEACAAELLAILDAEGDGGAVSCEAMRLLIAIREDDYLSDSSRHRIDTLRNTHPARSGVVSDEDVEAAMDAHNHAIYRNGNNRKLAMRAVLEHFAKGERHEH